MRNLNPSFHLSIDHPLFPTQSPPGRRVSRCGPGGFRCQRPTGVSVYGDGGGYQIEQRCQEVDTGPQ